MTLFFEIIQALKDFEKELSHTEDWPENIDKDAYRNLITKYIRKMRDILTNHLQ